LKVSEITYLYRPSAEAIVGGPNIITLEQAAIALASLSGTTRTVVAVKKESGQSTTKPVSIIPHSFGTAFQGFSSAALSGFSSI